jgi:hypothetical protein
MSESDTNKEINPAIPPQEITVPEKVKDKKPLPKPERPVRKFTESMSDNIADLAFALCKVQAACSNGKKDTQGYGYEYMSLDQLTDIIRPHLLEAGLAVFQGHELNKGANPTVITHLTLMHASGQWYKSSLEIPIAVMKQLSAAQMIGVAATYGRRYQLQAAFMIAAETDSDGTIK